jgi:molybdopterin-guanine dinucleotide biosynthesis protein
MDTQEIKSICQMAAVAEQLVLLHGFKDAALRKAVASLNERGWGIDIREVFNTSQKNRAKWETNLPRLEPAQALRPEASKR